MAGHELVDDYLFVWVLLAVSTGLVVPDVAVVTQLSTPILAVMVGAVALTLTPDRFRAIDRRGLIAIFAAHLTMPLLALGMARLLTLSPALTAGFVLVGAVTPELVTPTMTELAGGDTALASVSLVGIGIASTAVIPVVTGLVLTVAVDALAIVEQLLVAVVVPMVTAVGIRARYGQRVGQYDNYYPSVSAVMVVLIIGGVAGANAGLVQSNLDVLAFVAMVALALNVVGYALGWLVTAGRDRATRITGVLSVGMRDFAVAAALVVAAGFPTAASLPAVVFGVCEMATSAALARYFSEGGTNAAEAIRTEP